LARALFEKGIRAPKNRRSPRFNPRHIRLRVRLETARSAAVPGVSYGPLAHFRGSLSEWITVAAYIETMPIIFITGHGDIPMSVQAMKAGAIEFLTNPFATRRCSMRFARRSSATAQIESTEVLALVVTGLLNKQIAAALGTTDFTDEGFDRVKVEGEVHRVVQLRRNQSGELFYSYALGEFMNRDRLQRVAPFFQGAYFVKILPFDCGPTGLARHGARPTRSHLRGHRALRWAPWNSGPLGDRTLPAFP
jgi:hypothetical protein